MKVVLCQTDIVWEDKPANHAKVRRMLDSAPEACRGALIVLPEMFSTGFSLDVPHVQEGAARTSENFLSELAKKYSACVVGGTVEGCAEKKGLNQSLTFGPDGRLLTRYSKMQPFTLSGEAAVINPGNETALFEFGGFKIAPFVCYDLRFPEIFRKAAIRGAQVFTVIANWPYTRGTHWTVLLRARAIENQAYVIGVNRCGRDPNYFYPGTSIVVDPRGEIVTDCGNGESLGTATLDLQTLLDYRQDFPALKDILPEFKKVFEQ